MLACSFFQVLNFGVFEFDTPDKKSDNDCTLSLSVVAGTATRVQCPHCGHLYESHIQQLRHLAACHRDYLDATEVGRLGKVILYQRTARLFHCAKCFYTFKDFSKLFVHLITKHCMAEEEKERQRKMEEVGEAMIIKYEGGIKGDVEGKMTEETGQEEEEKAEVEMEEEEEILERTRGVEGVQPLGQNGALLRPRPTEDGYCCPACGYKHQLEMDVVEHLACCHGMHWEDSTQPVKKREDVEGGEAEGEEGSSPKSSGQPHLKAKDSVSKYISYMSCRYSCQLCGYCAKTKGTVSRGVWQNPAESHGRKFKSKLYQLLKSCLFICVFATQF